MNSPRFVALEWNAPELYDTLGELSSKYGWHLLYCVAHNLGGRINADFPGAIYQETMDARFGQPAPELAGLPRAAIDQPTAQELSFAEIMCLKQMDRMELLGGFNLHDRLIHFHRLFGYWSAVFEKLKPDVVLMPTSPHVTYDYVAYLIARRRGIPIVLFEYVTLAGLLTAMDGFENGIPRIIEAYARLRATPPSGHVALSDRMEEHLRALKGKYESAMPFGLKDILASAEARKRDEREEERRRNAAREEWINSSRWRRFRKQMQKVSNARQSRRGWLSPSILAGAYRKSLQAPVVPPKPAPAADGYWRGEFRKSVPDEIANQASEYRQNHIAAVTRRYNELAVDPDLSRPYVYVALHLQPERATNPNGWVFDEQHAIVGLIASVLPAGWQIYVKEHPSHFVGHYATERGRWSTLYERILEYPAASLVSRNTPSFSLIDNARAVATVTGTSSWEALVRGVPTLVFGEAWYKGCDGAYTVRSADECKVALERIAAGERPNEEAVRLFLRAAEEVSFVGYISSDDAHIAGTDEATNTERLAAAIEDCYLRSAKTTGLRPVAK